MASMPAQPRTALVLGGGISGLLSARELASAGYQVTVLEAGPEWGGCVGSHTVAGLTLDSGAESFATRSDAVARLAGELGLAGSIVPPRANCPRRASWAFPPTRGTRKSGGPWASWEPSGPPWTGSSRPLWGRWAMSSASPSW
jgi:phytoene dehydrogenase-like protein